MNPKVSLYLFGGCVWWRHHRNERLLSGIDMLTVVCVCEWMAVGVMMTAWDWCSSRMSWLIIWDAEEVQSCTILPLFVWGEIAPTKMSGWYPTASYAVVSSAQTCYGHFGIDISSCHRIGFIPFVCQALRYLFKENFGLLTKDTLNRGDKGSEGLPLL